MLVKRKNRIMMTVLAVLICMAMSAPVMGVDGSASGVRTKAAGTAENVSTESQLSAALKDLSTDSENPTVITVTADIDVAEEIQIPAGRYAEISGSSAGRKIRMTGTHSSAQYSDDEAMVTVAGGLTVSDLSFDANGRMRVMTINKGADVELDKGALITGGLIGTRAEICGAGVYMYGSRTSPAKLKMQDGSSISGNCAARDGENEFHVDGIGIYMGSYAQVDMEGGSISGNIDKTSKNIETAASGGGVYMASSGSTFDLNGGTISGNLAKESGGGVYIARGTMNINGGTVADNTTCTNGGGIYDEDAVNIKAGSISGNKVNAGKSALEGVVDSYGNGGGIFIGSESNNQKETLSSEGKVVMNGGSISGNSASSEFSSGTYDLDVGQGGGVYDGGQFRMTAGTVSGNSAAANDASNRKAGNGGGLAVGGGNYPGTAELNGGSIRNNSAAKKGSDVYLNADNTTVEMTSPYAKTLTEEPGILKLSGALSIGSLYLPSRTAFEVTGSLSRSDISIDSESTDKGTVVGEGDGYEIVPTDARILKNAAGSKVFESGDNTVVISEEKSGGYKSLTGAEVSAIADQKYSGSALKPEPEVTLGGSTLVKGKDYVLQYADNFNAGTAEVHVIGTGDYDGTITASFKILPKEISGASTEAIRDRIYTGGEIKPALKIDDGGTVLTEGTDYSLSYQNNVNVGKAEVTISGRGNYTGTAQAEFNIISAEGRTICTSAAELQQAINDSAGTQAAPQTIYVKGTVAAADTLNVPAGKYVYLVGADDDTAVKGGSSDNEVEVSGEMTAAGIVFDADRGTAGSGRVMHVAAGGKVVLEADTVVTGGNFAGGSGIYNEGTLDINGASIRENKYVGTSLLAVNGGGVNNAGTLNMTAGSISGNGSVNGGGIYNSGELNVTGGSVSSNTSSGDEKNSSAPGRGGGICNAAGGTAVLTNTSVTNNSTTEYGGGICNAGTMSMTKTDITGNSSGRNGAGIYSDSSSGTVFNSGTISENSIDNRTIYRVNSCGGGICVGGGAFTMNGGTVSGNTVRNRYYSKTYYASLGNGGGVYVANNRDNHCVFTMNGGEIKDNSAKSSLTGSQGGHGGGIYVMGGDGANQTNGFSAYPGKLVLNGGSITGNRASDSGSGVYINNCESVYASGSFIDPAECSFAGNAVLSIGGGTNITGNGASDLFLTDGTEAEITSALTGGIKLASAAAGDAEIAAGQGYTLTDQDRAAFTNEKGIRTVTLDTGNNVIYLQAVDLDGAYTAATDSSEYTFTGENIRPQVTVTKTGDGSKLVQDTDYTVTYERSTAEVNDENETYTVTIKGAGDYKGTISKTYRVVQCDIADVKADVPVQNYTGRSVLLPANPGITLNGYTLIKGNDNDYVIDASSYKNNVEIGTASVSITGSHNFKGTKIITYRIVKNVSLLSVGSIGDMVYTGSAQKPSLRIRDGGRTLTEGQDYLLTCTGNIVPGRAAAVITGSGSYTGSRTVYFNIVPKKVNLQKAKSSRSRQLTVKWSRDGYASGYQITAATNKKFTKNARTVTAAGSGTCKKTIKKLKKKKYYYVRIRSYINIAGTKHYGAFSKVKKVRVK